MNFSKKGMVGVVLALLLAGLMPVVYAQESEDEYHDVLCEVERDREMTLTLSQSSGLPGSTITAEMSITLIEGDRPRGWRDAGFAWTDGHTIIGDWVIVSVVDGAGNPFAGYGTWSVPAGETLTGYATATLTVPNVEPGSTLHVMVCVGHPHGPGDMHWYDFTVESFMVVPETMLGGIGVVAALLGATLLYARRGI
ncbi:MAG: hypothetical protein QW475_01980 [Candidatus Nitrosocaldus sp.]